MEILIWPKVMFVVDAVRLPLIVIVVVVVVIVICHRHLSTVTWHFSRCLIEKSLADAILSIIRKSNLASIHLVSPGTRIERFDGSAIRDNRTPSAIRFVRTCESRVNHRAISIAYLSLNSPLHTTWCVGCSANRVVCKGLNSGFQSWTRCTSSSLTSNRLI